MKLSNFATHTIDTDRLTPNGWVLDAGCRGFDFTSLMASRGQRVVALDADPFMQLVGLEARVTYVAAALSAPRESDMGWLLRAGNGSRVDFGEKRPHSDAIPCYAVSVVNLMRELSIAHWDAVKLDIEGGEYEVLLSWPGPVASQISVEYHEHTRQGMAKHGNDIYTRILDHLSRWYEIAQDDWVDCGAGPNAYDTLWVLK